jgi:SOS-response transcriptional repressor LexA
VTLRSRAPLTCCPKCGHSLGRSEAPLTPTQERVYRAIASYVLANGRAPTLTELAAACGFNSENAAHRHVNRLEAKGWVRRHRWQRRGIEPLVRTVPLERGPKNRSAAPPTATAYLSTPA